MSRRAEPATMARRALRVVSLFLRLAIGIRALLVLSTAARPAAKVRPTHAPVAAASVIVPARDEATRIGPLLERVVGAPAVGEVIVVDDESSDDTAGVAGGLGATVVAGVPLPPGWAGKAWAIQQGVEAAGCDWVVALDADTRPHRDLVAAAIARAQAERFDLLTLAASFECPTAPARWLHASMLASLVYRYGAPGGRARSGREMANGQCMVFRRQRFIEAGGMAPVAGSVVEDVALARTVAARGGRVAFLDASELLTVHMFESFTDTLHGWGRSLALPGVDPRRRQLVGLAVVVVAQTLPLVRIAAGCCDLVDRVLAGCRIGVLVGTRRVFRPSGISGEIGHWLSPLADPISAVSLAAGIVGRGPTRWRGRSYPRSV